MSPSSTLSANIPINGKYYERKLWNFLLRLDIIDFSQQMGVSIDLKGETTWYTDQGCGESARSSMKSWSVTGKGIH